MVYLASSLGHSTSLREVSTDTQMRTYCKNQRKAVCLAFLHSLQLPCPGDGATHSGLGSSVSIKNQNSTDTPTGQCDLINIPIVTLSSDDPRIVTLTIKANQDMRKY